MGLKSPEKKQAYYFCILGTITLKQRTTISKCGKDSSIVEHQQIG